MPTTTTIYECFVWFLLGLCVGSGWTLGAWLVTRILGKLFS